MPALRNEPYEIDVLTCACVFFPMDVTVGAQSARSYDLSAQSP